MSEVATPALNVETYSFEVVRFVCPVTDNNFSAEWIQEGAEPPHLTVCGIHLYGENIRQLHDFLTQVYGVKLVERAAAAAAAAASVSP